MRIAPPLASAAAILFAGCASRAVGADVPDAIDVTDVSEVIVVDAPDDIAIMCAAPLVACGDQCIDTRNDPLHCGADCAPCPDPGHGATASCIGSVCSPRCPADFVARDERCVDAPPPRPVRPLSNASVTVRNPTLRWVMPDGASAIRISICRDRACTSLVTEFDATGTSIRVPMELPRGVWFWNLRVIDRGVASNARSATWTFETPAVSAPAESSRVDRPDVNGDGIDDFAIAECDGAGDHVATSLFPGRIDGGVAPETLPPGWPLNIGDVDGDGFTDFALYTRDRVDLYRGGAAPADRVMLATTDTGNAPGTDEFFNATGDFDGDGYGDVVVGFANDANLRVAFGSPTGWIRFQTLSMSARRSLVAADLDGDGFDDILSRHTDFSWWRGGPTGLADPVSIPPTQMEGFDTLLAVGDLDGDGFLDVIGQTNYSGMGFFTLVRGGRPQPVATMLGALAGGGANAIFSGSFGDYDDDGHIDLMFMWWGAPLASPWHVLLGGANGYAYTEERVPELPCTPPGSFAARTVGDWNADGRQDNVMICGDHSARLRLATGDGTSHWITLPNPAGTGPCGMM